MHSEQDIAALCVALIGTDALLSAAEVALVRSLQPSLLEPFNLRAVRAGILGGVDILGDAFSRVRSSVDRRAAGAVYTPKPVVDSMLQWLAGQDSPERIVDPGAGSGRFVLAAGARFPKASLVAVEMDPLAALMLRANLAVFGFDQRTTIYVQDYRSIQLQPMSGKTAFIANPPYVRHHDISLEWKSWYRTQFAAMGIKASALAGLHLHFFLKTRLLARPGDVGVFVTSAEWMDVNYGSALRELLLGDFGGVALHVLAPTLAVFEGTSTTAAITCFRVGEVVQPLRVRSVNSVSNLNGLMAGANVPREQLRAAPRWSVIVRPTIPQMAGTVELGELCRVHRGQVTGAHGIWIAGDHSSALPDCVKLPAVTKARDLIVAGSHLTSANDLRRVVDLPTDFGDFSDAERVGIAEFLAWAKTRGAHQGYVATHRKAWWAVGLKAPAPILCTYMARRPPQFTVNACGARHINIAHGLYPRDPLTDSNMNLLVAWLNKNVNTGSGRTYAGGLTKFEPKEIERLRVPTMEALGA